MGVDSRADIAVFQPPGRQKRCGGRVHVRCEPQVHQLLPLGAFELALPPVKIHCSILAEDAVKAAIADYRAKQHPAEQDAKKE